MRYLRKSPIAETVKRLAAIFGFSQPPPELPSCIDEQQQSPLRFRFDAVVEEYRMVWENIQKLLSNQQNLVNYTITLIAGLLALSQILRGDQPLDEFAVRYRPVYPFISILFSAFSLMYMEHDAAMAHLAACRRDKHNYN